MKLVIIDYGAGNIKSVKYALERIGVNAELTNDLVKIEKADKVILPGVGEASSAMAELKKYELDKLIPALKQPVLGICLGIQLMCEFTEEGNTDCMGIFPIKVKKFSTKLKVPQVGWNNISKLKTCLFNQVKENEYVYFVHSFYAPLSEYTIAQTTYDKEFSAALQKDNFYACQFHPEKSSDAGQQILKNFVNL
jgi:glutamine amidotransferase